MLKDRPDMVAIADDSGATPTQTDDGVLWLNLQLPLRVDKDNVCLIPLTTADGSSAVAPTDFQTLLLLAAEYDWQIVGARDQTYTVNAHTRL
jgi:hypothetical protein